MILEETRYDEPGNDYIHATKLKGKFGNYVLAQVSLHLRSFFTKILTFIGIFCSHCTFFFIDCDDVVVRGAGLVRNIKVRVLAGKINPFTICFDLNWARY